MVKSGGGWLILTADRAISLPASISSSTMAASGTLASKLALFLDALASIPLGLLENCKLEKLICNLIGNLNFDQNSAPYK